MGGLALGRFGWADLTTGQVQNTYAPDMIGGLVFPRAGTWALVYQQDDVWYLRAGKPAMVVIKGDFFVRFPSGAYIGNSVYADPATGIAYDSDGGGFIRMPWKVMMNVTPGSLAIISPYQHLS